MCNIRAKHQSCNGQVLEQCRDMYAQRQRQLGDVEPVATSASRAKANLLHMKEGKSSAFSAALMAARRRPAATGTK
jgi:hypothetical protein